MNLTPRTFFLDDVFDGLLTSRETPSFKCDIYEKNDKYYIEADLPGYKKEDVQIETDNGYLTLKVSKVKDVKDEKKNYIKRERYSSEYQRSFYTGDINPEEVKATFKNGVLQIEIPKEEIVETKKVIEIQ